MGSLLRNTVFLLSNPTFLLSQPVISLIVTCSGGSDPSADQDLFSAWEWLDGIVQNEDITIIIITAIPAAGGSIIL